MLEGLRKHSKLGCRGAVPLRCIKGAAPRWSWDWSRVLGLGALPKQELSHCGIFRQADRPVIGVSGFRDLPEALQEMSADRPIRLVMRHGSRVNRL